MLEGADTRTAAAAAKKAQPRSRTRVVLEYVVTVAVAIAIALVVQAYVVKPFRVPTPSMANTVHAGDRVLIDRVLYGHRNIQRGDIVVFRGGAMVDNQVLLKRVVGVPGDVLLAKGGKLYVNGKPLDEPYIRKVGGSAETTEAGPGGPGAPWSLQEPYTVPQGEYFVLGDNRTDSFDSRFWGPVARSTIMGRAMVVYWPLPGIRALH